ncbi:glycosyltransferase family 2 protein [Georgenia satyanarayanai]|uniref:glycosyltransferase family 2 protein n=1 Tax=Georgenia satyanarayanai TaxID=860221 RepID=UPI001264E246|nr:glycosyltransferase family 2 protein [Georgenia satyanarayanai]
MSRDVVGAYATAAAASPRTLARALVRTKSRAGRDVLAALAADRRLTSTQLEDLGRRYLEGTPPGLPLDPRRVLDLARVVALQTDEPDDRSAALGLLSWVSDEHAHLLGEREATLLLQLAVKERRFPRADAVLANVPVATGAGRLAAADLANPWLRPGAEEASWLAALNAALFGPDAVQAGLLPDGDTPFDRLTTTSAQRVAHEKKITVVISCFNPDRHLLTAVRSVLEQTWQNIELFVVDDASPSPAPGVLEEVERMDARVTVVRKAVNGGTYRARNTALRLATGDFFTCLDSDDWAHPQRLELGVRPMLEDESLVATRSLGVRATEQMELGRVGYGGRFKAASSLMIRVFPVVNRVGFFDPVRKAADNEYALRVESAFDGKVVDVPTHALTVLLADAGSLSASDYSSGWRHPARSEYLEAYSEWHRQVGRREAARFLAPHGPRPFPAPRRWERHPQDGEAGRELDVVVLADWREDWLQPGTLDRLHAYVAGGRRVGLVHHESLVEPVAEERPLARPVRELVQRGVVERVYLDDARHAVLTVVADPRVLQFPPLLSPRLTSGRVVVVEQAADHYTTADVERHVRELLGADPEWGAWPAAPDPAELVAGVPAAAGTVDLGDTPEATGDLTVGSWLLREPADAERGARLSVVRRVGVPGGGPETRELSDAWAAGAAPWEETATDWLDRSPGAVAVAVRTASALRVVVAAGLRAEATGAHGIRIVPDGAGSRLLVLHG